MLDGVPPPRPWWRSALRWTVFLLLTLANAGLVAAVAGYFWLSGDLPSVESLSEYRPPVVSEIVSADGQLVGELFEERRRVVDYDRIPRHVVQAFLAAEDKNFFQHHGVDWLGTLRAGVNTYVLRRKVQGGSTITQQTAKALLVSSEGFAEGTRRNLRRKAREAILAARLERAFGKEELLWLYLNGVYLGHHSYGIESASENYFRKTAGELTVAEAALLAGLPQAPSRYSPVLHPDAARRRRSYVLRRMREDGAITEEVRRAADESPVQVHAIDDPFREVAPFYAEAVRRRVVERHGNPRALRDGLRVETAMDLDAQRAAQQAMLRGLLDVDRRQGFWGPVARVQGAEREALRRRLSQAWPAGSLRPGDFAVGIVSAVNDAAGQATVEVGDEQGVLPISGMRWARIAQLPGSLGARHGPAPLRGAPRRRRGGGAPGGARGARRAGEGSGSPASPPRCPPPRCCWRSSRSPGSRARWSRRTRAPATSAPWWAATTSRPPSSTGPSRPAASPGAPSSPSSTPRPSRSSPSPPPP